MRAREVARVFGTPEDQPLHPERFSRTFRNTIARCRKALGDGGAPPMIRLHDLCHTHATLMLAVYGHVMPGDQKRAASRFAALVGT